VFIKLKKFFISIKTRFGPKVVGLAGVFGIISDLLSPLAPISAFIFFVGIIFSIILIITYFINENLKLKIEKSLVYSLAITLTSGCFYFFQPEEKNTGLVANIIPAIENLQKDLGLIKKDIDELKEKTDIVISKLDDLRQNFSNLSKKGVIIENPETPEEFYHNARFYELKGNYLKARLSYESYFNFNLNYIDPHIRFQKILKLQEGIQGARKYYRLKYPDSKNNSNKLASILILPDKEKLFKLELLNKNYPNFGPVFYYLSYMYSIENLGKQTGFDKKKQNKYLDLFFKSNKNGNFVKFFIDKSLASEVLSKSKILKKFLEKDVTTSMQNLVFFQYQHLRYNKNYGEKGNTNEKCKYVMADQYEFNFSLGSTEGILEYFIKLPNEEEYFSLGISSSMNLKTGKPYPYGACNINIAKKNMNKNFDIGVKFRDINNVIQPSINLNVDIKTLLKKLEMKNNTLKFKTISRNTSSNFKVIKDDFDKTEVSLSFRERCYIKKVIIINTNVENKLELNYAKCDIKSIGKPSELIIFEVYPNDFPLLKYKIITINNEEIDIEKDLSKMNFNNVVQ